MAPSLFPEFLMRRSTLHAIVASLLALVMVGCSDDTTSTGPKAAANAAQIPNPPIVRGPLFPPGPNDFVQITAGSSHTCARKLNNTVYCWGVNNNGQAGIPSSHMCATVFGNIACIDQPTILQAPLPQGGTDTLRATTIDAGANHTCVIDAISDAYCWGLGNVGQVGAGMGSLGVVTQATKVAGGLKYSLISAGSQSTCGSGPSGLFCWGRIQGNASSPVLVSSFSFLNLSVGDLHACVIGSSNGGIQCWGDNTFGQLSLDPATHPSASFVALATFNNPSSSVVTESNFTCANENTGMIECAGDNTWGQLGNGQSGTSHSTGTPQLVGGGQVLSGVSTGTMHACALDPSYHAWCWGNGISGQLGNNAPGVYSTPQPVSGGHTFRAIAVGYQHTCGITTDNHIYCWGINNFAQLGTAGHNTNTFVAIPVRAVDP